MKCGFPGLNSQTSQNFLKAAASPRVVHVCGNENDPQLLTVLVRSVI